MPVRTWPCDPLAPAGRSTRRTARSSPRWFASSHLFPARIVASLLALRSSSHLQCEAARRTSHPRCITAKIDGLRGLRAADPRAAKSVAYSMRAAEIVASSPDFTGTMRQSRVRSPVLASGRLRLRRFAPCREAIAMRRTPTPAVAPRTTKLASSSNNKASAPATPAIESMSVAPDGPATTALRAESAPAVAARIRACLRTYRSTRPIIKKDIRTPAARDTQAGRPQYTCSRLTISETGSKNKVNGRSRR